MALLVVVLRSLFAAQHEGAVAGLGPALGAAGVGLIVAGLLHHVWLSIPVAWLFFAAAGVALSAERSANQPAAYRPVESRQP